MINQKLPKILENYILRNGTKKFKFWNNFLIGKAGLYALNDVNKTLTQEYFKQITKIKKAFDSMFQGEETWGFTFEKTYRQLVLTGIMVHFPYITITNSENQGGPYEKKDFYLFFKIEIDTHFNEGEIKIRPPAGFSSTMDFIENGARNDYINKPSFKHHPHLTRHQIVSNTLKSYISQPNFCLGVGHSGLIISSVFTSRQTQESLEFFLYTVKEFLKVESEDGGPYWKIRYLCAPNQNDINKIKFVSDYIIDALYLNFIKENIEIFSECLEFVDFTVNSIELSIKDTQSFRENFVTFVGGCLNTDSLLVVKRKNELNNEAYVRYSDYLEMKKQVEQMTTESGVKTYYYDEPFILETKKDQIKYHAETGNNVMYIADVNTYRESDFALDINLLIKKFKSIFNEEINKTNKQFFYRSKDGAKSFA